MMKNFGYKKDGSHWSIWNKNTYVKICGDFTVLDFYPLPTLKFFYSEDTFETDDHEFSIELVWLCWVICITRYWGKAYRKRVEVV